MKNVKAGDKEYVRVFGRDKKGKLNKIGRWIMLKSDIEGLTPEQIKDKFALSFMPTHICDVKPSSDFVLQASIANELKWGKGGGLQFAITDEVLDLDIFGKKRNLN